MKRFLLIFLILITAGSLVAQTPTVASLTTTSGTAIQWYSAATGGTLYTGAEALVNGQHYYGSQTVNGVESAARLDVIATVTVIPAAPTQASHVITQTQIDWKWSAVSGATGYKWSATNNYSTATDLGNVLVNSESGLTCGTSYTRYIWAYNTTACGSTAATFTQSTTSCITAPSLTTSAVTNIGSTSATLNGNISSVNGANASTRGFKYSITDGFNPATTGTNISETGNYGTGNFNLSPSGLSTTTTYYVVAYATNSVGTTYGSQVSFTTLIQTDYAYTGGQQTFTVPAGITTINIEAWGAQGGTGWINGSLGSGIGGNGGYAKGTLSVTQGQTIYLYVGGQGGSTSNIGVGGYNGGGTSQDNDGDSDDAGGGGGGASDIRIGGVALSDRVLVAGGGGGGGCNSGNGGAGGGTSGLQGLGSTGGLPGTQVSGYTLGTGQSAVTADSSGGGVVGSGGGGYYGGYRGGSDYFSGGGGGSSYTGGVTSGSTTADQRSGNGRILISY
jgi:hypothetical protein